MPELPEVEQFRQILLPLVSPPLQQRQQRRLSLALVNETHVPRQWLSPHDINEVSEKYICVEVLRKGKLLCLVLDLASGDDDDNGRKQSPRKRYLFLHMGMTGRISAPNRIVRLENVKDDDGSAASFPPPYCYLTFQMGEYRVAFTDPRKFGSAQLSSDMTAFDELAPDALLDATKNDDDLIVETILTKMSHQPKGIKSLLLDQRRIVSGVGNWVADEVLYQCEMHPDQRNLTLQQARELWKRLQHILTEAVACLKQDCEFPNDWLFGYRWTRKKNGSKDSKGRPLTFLTSGGRTSAIVASVQKLRKAPASKRSSPSPKAKTTDKCKRPNRKEELPVVQEEEPTRKKSRKKDDNCVRPREAFAERGRDTLANKLTIRQLDQ